MPSHADDYYALLGVHDSADNHELRRAWRQLAALWHPDRAGVEATAKFQQLSAAYTVLGNPTARAAYDRRRSRQSKGTGAPSVPNPSPAAARNRSRPPTPAVMLSRLTGTLSTLLARGAARLDEPGVVTLVLNQTEAAQGGMARITILVDIWCPHCVAKKQSPCPRCNSTRKIEALYSAWLAVPPGVTAGKELAPSAELPGMVESVRFRVALREPK